MPKLATAGLFLAAPRCGLIVLTLCLCLPAAPGPCLAANGPASAAHEAVHDSVQESGDAGQLLRQAGKSPLAALKVAQYGIDVCNSDYFNQVVDVPAVVDKASDPLLAALRAQSTEKDQSGQAMLLIMLATANEDTLAMLRPLLTSEVRGLVNTGINGCHFAGHPQKDSKAAKGSLASLLDKMSPGRRCIVPGKVLSQEGDRASVTAKFVDPKEGAFDLLLVMQQENGLWRVKEISNARKLFEEAIRRGR